jgi:ADP-ribosylglycohydrolase
MAGMDSPVASSERADRLCGLLLGTAVGDALGLPREGLSRQRAARIHGAGTLRHRFVLGRGMLSDDTEHACMAAQALLAAPASEALFARSLAWRLRGWLLAVPPAVGWGTLRSIGKLWLGFSPQRSGVGSAGNGPAMRAPVLGACLARTDRIGPLVRASTRITHTDPRAEGARRRGRGRPRDAQAPGSALRR